MPESPEKLREEAGNYFQETLNLMRSGKPEKALESLQKAEEAAQQAKADDILLHVMNIRGQLMLSIGALDEALEICGHASNLFAEILTQNPENDFVLQCLQMNLNNVGIAGNHFESMGHFPQAKDAYETGLSVSQKMLDLLPQDDFCIIYTANTLNNLGSLLFDMGSIEEAKEKYEKALGIYEELLKTDPENVAYQSDVAMTLNNLGTLLSDTGNLEEAKDRYETSLEIYEALLKTDPENVGYQSFVETTLNNLGNLLSDMGSTEEAKAKYEKALDILKILSEKEPEDEKLKEEIRLTQKELEAL
ncbi:MAG: tetratricopeptide repeat protein [Methanosarcinaceae archaeon]